MPAHYEIALIIPCLNEEQRVLAKEYPTFLAANPNVLICFVDDGSTDNTQVNIEHLISQFKDNVVLVSLKENTGKAEAVKNGVNYCNNNYKLNFIGYLDADLSVSLEECLSMTKHFQDEILFCFGSRIARIGSNIQRRRSRFLIGRVIATFISIILSIKVYDTQCGCKVFTQEHSKKIFKEHFISKWLFDVELFFRTMEIYGRKNYDKRILEVPLKQWIDKGASKVKYSYIFKLIFDLLKIKKRYKNKIKS